MAYMKDSSGRRLDSIKVVAKPGIRTPTMMLTAPNALSSASALNLLQRTMTSLTVDSVRWRIGFRNLNLRDNVVPTTPATIEGVYVGEPAFATSSTSGARWAGDCKATMTQVSGNLTVPVNGARVWSSWITSEATQFVKGAEKVIGWKLNTTNTGTGIVRGNGYQGMSASGATNAADVAAVTGKTVGANQLYLDVAIEYEFTDATNVVAFGPGDSNMVGFTAAPQGITAAGEGALPHESWPQVAAAMGGFVAVNLGVGSSTTANWDPTSRAPVSSSVDYFPQLWDRLGSVDIDAFVVSIGTNGLGESLNAFVARMQAIHTKIRAEHGNVPIWWTTIPPRCYPDGSYDGVSAPVAGTLAANIAVGATTLTTQFSPAVGTANLLLGLGPNMEDVNVVSVTGPSSGLYTVTISATTKAHYTGEPLSQGDERLRRYRNNFIRNKPDGIAGVFDFERLLESAPGSPTLDPRYANADWLHHFRSAGALKASQVVGVGVRPLFG